MPIQDMFSAYPQTALGRKLRKETTIANLLGELPEPYEGWGDNA